MTDNCPVSFLHFKNTGNSHSHPVFQRLSLCIVHAAEDLALRHFKCPDCSMLALSYPSQLPMALSYPTQLPVALSYPTFVITLIVNG